MNIIWSPRALADIEEAVDYLVERRAPAAEKLATGVVALVERLAAEELDGPMHFGLVVVGAAALITNDEGPPLRRVSGPSCESPESGAFALLLHR